MKCLNSICMMISSATCRDIRNYQSYPPESVGRQHSISFSKYSGRKTIIKLLEAKGVRVTGENVDQVMVEIQDQIHQLKRPLRVDDILGIVASA